MIERHTSIFARFGATESSFFPPSEVLATYREVNSGFLPDYIAAMVRLYPNWHRQVLTSKEVGQLTWYFAKNDPSHMSWELTQGGKRRRVREVAQVYLSVGPQVLAEKWPETGMIEAHVESLKKGEALLPLIIVKGSRYPDSPDSSFIDGVHRSLAIGVYAIKVPDNELKIEAYVGQKASFPARVLKRLAQKADCG